MWDYSEKVRDHYLNPRNVGEIESPDGFGETGNIKCGDALRLTFKLDGSGKIEDMKFKTFGCGSAIASSSILTEMCKGLSVDEAAKITNDDIAKELEGLPDAKMHCSVMGQEALELAIAYYQNGGEVVKKEYDSKIICTCFNVTEGDIEKAIRQNGLTNVEQVTNYTKAGGGCGACLEEIGKVVDRVNREIDEENHDHDHGHSGSCSSTQSNETPYSELTTIAKIDVIRETLNEYVRPGLQKDGGDCELIDLAGDTVKIKFAGACSSCAFSGVTQNDFIAKTLQDRVYKELVVELVQLLSN